jgi:very-short-patch-repair endonuclease
MDRVNDEIESIKEKIAKTISSLETGATIPDVCFKLGFPKIDSAGLSKYSYLQQVLNTINHETLINGANLFVNDYPGNRSKPDKADIECVRDSLLWIATKGIQQISNLTRIRIAESIEGISFWGRKNINDFFKDTIPNYRNSLQTIGTDKGNHLYYDYYNVLDIFPLQSSKPHENKWIQTSILEILQSYNISKWPDQRFIYFVERMIHPEIQLQETQEILVSLINPILQEDGYSIYQDCLLSGLPVYRIKKNISGVSGSPKYIIFASVGKKPDIIISDTINMDIRVLTNENLCLVYDQPPTNSDLTWDMLVQWWGKKTGSNTKENTIRQDLGNRLRSSLQEGPEKLFFDTYFKHFLPLYKSNLPALLPQVYLHYDPRSKNERGFPVLNRQRMDFLMLLRNSSRIVIEIDGRQHYSDAEGKALPKLYAKTMEEDRRIKLLGYEVFRFGGAEFVNIENVKNPIITFFEDLFSYHDIHI